MRTLTIEETEQVSGGLVSPDFVFGLVAAAPEIAMGVAFGAVDTGLGVAEMGLDLATSLL